MPNSPSFNLDHAVATWREELARQPGLTPADLRELEAHLRDAFAELPKLDLHDDEAFLVARHRVGPPKPVAAEFAKAAPARVWAPRVFWMAFGALVIQLWQMTLSLWCSALSMDVSFDGIHLPEWIGWVVPALLFLLVCGVPVLFFGRWLARGGLEVLARLVSTRTRVAILGATLFLSAFGLQMLALFYFLTQTRPASGDLGVIVGGTAIMEYNLIFYSLWPLCLIALMVWLTPRRAKVEIRAMAT